MTQQEFESIRWCKGMTIDVEIPRVMKGLPKYNVRGVVVSVNFECYHVKVRVPKRDTLITRWYNEIEQVFYPA